MDLLKIKLLKTKYLKACKKGNWEKVKELLPKLLPRLSHDDLIIKDENERTLLHSVCLARDLDIAKELLSKLDYNDLIMKDYYGWSPLHNACSDSLEIAKELIFRLNHRDLITKTESGQTPLHIACCNQNTKIVKELLLRLNHNDLIIKTRTGNTPLHCSVTCLGTLKVLLKRLKYGDLVIQNKDGFIPMCFAFDSIWNNKDLKFTSESVWNDFAFEYVQKERVKLLILNGSPIIDHSQYNAYNDICRLRSNNLHECLEYNVAFMKGIKWTRSEHKNVMHIQTRKNMQMMFMVYKYKMLEKL